AGFNQTMGNGLSAVKCMVEGVSFDNGAPRYGATGDGRFIDRREKIDCGFCSRAGSLGSPPQTQILSQSPELQTVISLAAAFNVPKPFGESLVRSCCRGKRPVLVIVSIKVAKLYC